MKDMFGHRFESGHLHSTGRQRKHSFAAVFYFGESRVRREKRLNDCVIRIGSNFSIFKMELLRKGRTKELKLLFRRSEINQHIEVTQKEKAVFVYLLFLWVFLFKAGYLPG
ncbi:hypothetical protein [Niastella vici]|uniref:hypothetical protein n=1 Tax=Niastella vici TaxID=1703345 RepID=UPI001301E93F|nr:hypothetical protein [Niastella vici]